LSLNFAEGCRSLRRNSTIDFLAELFPPKKNWPNPGDPKRHSRRDHKLGFPDSEMLGPDSIALIAGATRGGSALSSPSSAATQDSQYGRLCTTSRK
jgi:hypothetical protein